MSYVYQNVIWLAISLVCLLNSTVQAQVMLPIEVIGPDGYTEEVSFKLNDASGVATLYLKAHRLAYRDASANPGRGAKGSVKLNDGPWVDLDNSTVNCYEHEVAYGCLSGAYSTVRLTVPIEGAKAGQNILRFRFNGTDNFSSGYRILEFNLLKGQQKLLAKDSFTQDNPANWTAPRNNASDVAAGKALWETASLVDYPGGPTIKATCAGCHAQDGRDLEYFAFSNWSIQERAKFHGLDQQEAEQIASYIRSLKDSKGIKRLGRPWNPPYQPGPGLDSKPVEAWAAGAGLDWVLEEDQDMLSHLFPEGTSQKAIDRATANQVTHNVRQTPVALQLPDWQAWLPEVHPVDLWGEAFYNTDPEAAYQAARDALAGGKARALRQDPDLIRQKKLLQVLDEVRTATRDFVSAGGAQPCRNQRVHNSEGFGMLGRPTAAPAKDKWNDADVCERPLRSITHWNAVKHWEIMQEFDLEEATADVYPYGEARGWVGSWRQVFELAPHRIGNDSYSLVHLNREGGSYFNTAWYQLQLILNAGNRNPRAHHPPDWKYHLSHLFRAALDNGHPQPLRHVQALVKMQQNLDMRLPDGMDPPADYFPYRQDRGPNSYGWWILHAIPWRLVAIGDFANDPSRFAIWDQLNEVESGLKNKVQNALLKHWLDKTESYDEKDWVRGAKLSQLTPADYVPTPYDEARDGKRIGGGNYANNIYRTIPFLREAGISEDLIERLRLWGKKMWPRGDWDALRQEGTSNEPLVSAGEEINANQEYYIENVAFETYLQATNAEHPTGQACGETTYTVRGSDRNLGGPGKVWKLVPTGQAGEYYVENSTYNTRLQATYRTARPPQNSCDGEEATAARLAKRSCSKGQVMWRLRKAQNGNYHLYNATADRYLQNLEPESAAGGQVRMVTTQCSGRQVNWRLKKVEKIQPSTTTQSSLSLHPNPAQDWVQLQWYSEAAGVWRVLLHNAQGQVVRQHRHPGTVGWQQKSIPLGGLPQGLYHVVLRFPQEQKGLRKRLIVR